MDDLQLGIIKLIRSAITGEKCELPAAFDLEIAFERILKHHIVPMAYEGAVRCGIDKKLPVMQKMFQLYARNLLYSDGQLCDVEKICNAFVDAGIDYVPLKGCVIKHLYPKPEMRPMGDADILIRTEQYDRIKPIIAGLGFVECEESDHELKWNSKSLHLELHKRLIPSYNKDYYRYFGDGWQLARAVSATRYALSYEDEFIFLFTHFAKHYRDGGIGFRHVTDLFVYRRAHPDLDEQYISDELRKLQLDEFYRNIQKLIDVWFGSSEGDEKTEFITAVIYENGSWGNSIDHLLAEGVKNGQSVGSIELGRLRKLMRLIFPSAQTLQRRYPILCKAPILLPFLWPIRWITALIFRRDNVKYQQNVFETATPEKIKEYKQALNYVGLDYNFIE